MKFDILTLFPEMFPGVLDSSIMKRAQESGIVEFRVRNIRDYTTDKHHVTDDAPYGGGPGMVMKPEPIAAAFDAVIAENEGAPPLKVYLSPEGEPWNQRLAEEFAEFSSVALLCGHYEGIDERVREMYIDREISIGDYVLTGGELAAMVVIDSVVRLLPGALGNDESAERESFGAHGMLDHPHYTRPPEFREMKIPEMLLSGHHKNIEEWRRNESIKRTAKRRPDLIEILWDSLSKAERQIAEEFMDRQQSPPPHDP